MDKPGATLRMLRREIGDSAFFRGICAYDATHRHGNALTVDITTANGAVIFDGDVSRLGVLRQFRSLAARHHWGQPAD